MLILGLETSCDETGAAVVEDGARVRSNVIASQHDLHGEYAGVVPEIASRAHVERLLPVLREALRGAGVTLAEIDALAVGHRPGLIGSLMVGVAGAKALAWSLSRPLVGVDHIHAHLWAGALDAPAPEFPALGLVVSGGHTSLFDCRSPIDVELVGATIDDAVGEAYDKAGVILGLAYPGGPEVDRLAQRGDEMAHEFPVSRLEASSLDFSFSGLKTALLYRVRGLAGRTTCPHPSRLRRDTFSQREKEGGARALPEGEGPNLPDRVRADLAAGFQRAAVGALMLKVRRALERPGSAGVRTLLVGGGVSANSRLRAELLALGRERGMDVRLPRMDYCMDNAAMIAGLAFHRVRAGLVDGLTLAAAATGGS